MESPFRLSHFVGLLYFRINSSLKPYPLPRHPQRQHKTRPAPRLAQLQRPAPALRQRPRDGQPQPGPTNLTLARKERVEHPGYVGGGDAGAVVG